MHTDPGRLDWVQLIRLSKNKIGGYLQPVFTDVMEFDNFVRGKKLLGSQGSIYKPPGLINNQVIRINLMGSIDPLFMASLEKDSVLRSSGFCGTIERVKLSSSSGTGRNGRGEVRQKKHWQLRHCL